MEQELVTSNSQRTLNVGRGGTYAVEMLREERFRDGPGIKCILDIVISGRVTVLTMGSETRVAKNGNGICVQGRCSEGFLPD